MLCLSQNDTRNMMLRQSDILEFQLFLQFVQWYLISSLF